MYKQAKLSSFANQIRRNHMLTAYRLDPNWSQAVAHAKAVRPGFPRQPNSVQLTQSSLEAIAPEETQINNNASGQAFSNPDLCPCCWEKIYKKDIPLFEDSKELQILGAGIPIFYLFVRLCILILLIQFLTESMLAIVINYEYSTAHCGSVCPPRFSISTTDISTEFITEVKLIIRCTSFASLLLTLLYCRSRISNQIGYHDERTCSMSDYSIIIEGMDHKPGCEKRIRQMIKTELEKNLALEMELNKSQERSASPIKKNSNNEAEDTIAEIMLIPQTTYLDGFLTQLKLQLSLKANLLQSEKTPQQADQLIEIERTIQDLENKIRVQALRIHQETLSDKLPVDSAIVIFNTERDKDVSLSILRELDEPTLRSYLNPGATVVEASEPKEILWKNLNCTKRQTFISVLLGSLVGLLFVGIIFTVFFFLIRYKAQFVAFAFSNGTAVHATAATTTPTTTTETHQTNTAIDYEYQQRLAYAFALAIAAAIHIFNKFIMSKVLHKITLSEKWKSYSQQEFSFACKYAIGSFFTTSVMILLVEAFIHTNYVGVFGLIDEEIYLLIFNVALVPVLDIINFPYQIKRLKRYFKTGNPFYTQMEANYLMEDPVYEVGDKFAEVISIMWLTFLYLQLIPLASVFSMCALVLFYWIDKYNLLRRSSVQSHLDTKSCHRLNMLLQLVLILKPLGQIVFDYQLKHIYETHSWIMLGIGVLYTILPIELIVNWFTLQKFKPQEKAFIDVKESFKQNYANLHPIGEILNDLHGVYHPESKVKRSRMPTGLGKVSVRDFNGNGYGSYKSVISISIGQDSKQKK